MPNPAHPDILTVIRNLMHSAIRPLNLDPAAWGEATKGPGEPEGVADPLHFIWPPLSTGSVQMESGK